MKAIIFALSLSLATWTYAAGNILDSYVDNALQSNLALKQKDFTLKKSLAVLKEARSLFLPSVTISTRYSRAGGGRTIDFPIGDLINPVYQSLNEILQQPRFPTSIENESISLLREEEQESKIQLVQPIFQPAIYYNYKIKSNLRQMEQASRNAFTQQLVAQVKTAYFNYLKTVQVVAIYEETELLLQENLHLSESLYRNQKATKEVVFRAQAELSELKQESAEAEKNQDLAKAYFNFLLNRPFDQVIEIINVDSLSIKPAIDLAAAQSHALGNRDEFRQLQMAINATDNRVNLSKTSFLPGVSFVLDYGIQGEEYHLSADDDFWMASFVLEWNLFSGFGDKARIEQAKLEGNRLNTQLAELEKQIQLEVREVCHNLIVAEKSIVAAKERLVCARESFKIIDRKYRQGTAPQIEFLDARTTMTRAQINKVIVTYDYHIKNAELERITALYQVEVK